MVLLTGATGFLGSYLLEALISNKYDVVILKRSSSDISKITHLISKVVYYDVDLHPLEIAFENHIIDIVIHTACDYGKSSKSNYQISESNLMYGLKLLDASLKYKARFFINTDTMLPRQLNAYSLSKKQFVDWLRYKSSEIVVANFRLEYMYGKSDDNSKLVPFFLSKLSQNVPEIELTEGNQKRDFIFIDDVVSAIILVLHKVDELNGFSEFDLGTGKSVTLRYFLKKIKFEFESTFGITETKLAFGKLPYRDGEMMNVEINNSPLVKLGWSPKITLEVGIRKIINEMI